MSPGSNYANTSVAARPIHTQGALRNSQFLSAQELVSSPFKRSEILQTLIDVGAVLAGFLLALITGLGIAFAFFVLLFVQL